MITPAIDEASHYNSRLCFNDSKINKKKLSNFFFSHALNTTARLYLARRHQSLPKKVRINNFNTK